MAVGRYNKYFGTVINAKADTIQSISLNIRLNV